MVDAVSRKVEFSGPKPLPYFSVQKRQKSSVAGFFKNSVSSVFRLVGNDGKVYRSTEPYDVYSLLDSI